MPAWDKIANDFTGQPAAPTQQPVSEDAPVWEKVANNGQRQIEQDSGGGVVENTLNWISETFGSPKKNYMALETTPKGEGYYGEGLAGWARKTYARFMSPESRTEGIDFTRQKEIEGQAQQATDEWAAANPGLADYKDYYKAFVHSSELNKEKVKQGGVLAGAGVALKEAGALTKSLALDVGVMGALQAGDFGVRKVISSAQGVNEIADVTTTVPRWNPFEQQKQAIIDNAGPAANFLSGLDQFSKSFSPVEQSYNLFRYGRGQLDKGDYGTGLLAVASTPLALLGGPLGVQIVKGAFGGMENITGDAKEKEIVARNLAASNMLYTQMADPLARAEIMREIQSGEHPAIVEERWLNPWAELGGSLVLDPLNLIGMGAKGTRFLGNGAEIAPDIAKGLETMASGVDNAADAVKAGETVKAGIKAFTEAMATKTKGLEGLQDARGILSLTSDGKVFVTGRTTGGFIKQLVGEFAQGSDDIAGAADEAALYLNNMIKAATATDPDNVVKAMTELASSRAGKLAFTNTGMATMAVFKKMLEETDEAGKVIGYADPGKFVDGIVNAGKAGTTAAEKVALMADSAAAKMHKVAQDLFPSVEQMKTLNPEKYKALPEHVKILNATLSKDSTIGGLYRAANGFFAGIYMGLSPAFVIRNALTNTVSIIADEGAAVGLEATKAQFGDLFKLGATSKRQLGQLEKMLGSVPDELKTAQTLETELVGKADKKILGVLPSLLPTNTRVEQAARRTIMTSTIADEIDRAIRSGVLSDMQLLKGLTESQRSLVADVMRSSFGNTKEATEKIVAILKKTGGVVESHRVVQMPETLRNFARSLGVEGVADDLLSANSKDEFLTAAQKVADDIKSVRPDTEFVRPMENTVDAAIVEDSVKNIKGALQTNLETAFSNAVQTKASARVEAVNTAKLWLQNIPQTGDPALDKLVVDAMAKVTDLALEPNGAITKQNLMDKIGTLKPLIQEVEKGKISVEDALKRLDYKLPISGKEINAAEVFADVDKSDFFNFIWRAYEPRVATEYWGDFNHAQLNMLKSITGDVANRMGIQADPNMFAKANELMAEGFRQDNIILAAKGNKIDLNAILSAAEEAKAAAANVPALDIESIVKQANANLPEGVKAVNGIQIQRHFEKTGETMTEASIREYIASKGIGIPQGAAGVAETTAQTVKPFIRNAETAQSTLPAAIQENLDGFMKEWEAWTAQVSNEWGKYLPHDGTTFDENKIRAALKPFMSKVDDKMPIVRQTALEIARAKADFALHAYGDKRNIDTALSFIYPYQYWYSRSFKNWAPRLTQSPGIIADYGKYRKFLEEKHAGLPDWWKYNVSTNDLPGVNMDNPLYFNLEATLNPLNGLTGTDFNDSKKRVDWLSRTVDDLGKFGPSLFSPLSWLMAAKLANDGETDAAQRWLGRALPQSASIKAAAALVGKNLEVDPFVNLFQGGLDPYENNRVNRALAAMVDDGLIDQNQAVDAARAKSGKTWEAAILRATQGRAPGQLASFIGGVGFKGRSNTDMEIDQFYSNYSMVMAARPNMPPETFRMALAELGQKYPYMDALLIGGKADDSRNSAYAYNVLGRIPPGGSSDILKKVGISSEMVARFYDGKGTFKDWNPQDIQRFMAGVGDLGAVLAIPSLPTRKEWIAAKAQYDKVGTAQKAQLGSDILDKLDAYYSMPEEKRPLYMAAHPEIQQAFEMKTQAYAQDPLLYKYYGGLENLERFYKSQMYAALEQQYPGVSQKFTQYYDLKIADTKAAAKFYKANPDMAAYSKAKSAYGDVLIRSIARVGSYMPEKAQPIFRTDVNNPSATQQGVMQPPAVQMSWTEWQTALTPNVRDAVASFWMADEPLSSSASSEVDYLAGKYGFDSGDALLQSVGMAIQEERNAVLQSLPPSAQTLLQQIATDGTVSYAEKTRIDRLAKSLNMSSEHLLSYVMP